MSREQERIRRKLENNPIVECNKIQKKFYPELFSIGDISALFFLLSKCANLEIRGEKIDEKYSADSVSFSFSHPPIARIFS